MSVTKKSACIEFFCPVNEHTVTQMLDLAKQLRKNGIERLKILISSGGGSVFHAISAYNELKGLGIEIVTHNFGSVDSSSGIIFCAGSKRYSVPHARFLIHPLGMTLNGNFTEEQMEEQLKSFKIDVENTAGVLAEATNKDESQILKDMQDRKHLNPEQAKDYGLIDDIKIELVEAGEELHKVNSTPPQQNIPMPFRLG